MLSAVQEIDQLDAESVHRHTGEIELVKLS